jgi:DeoR family transcriptional regulator of aga operon
VLPGRAVLNEERRRLILERLHCDGRVLVVDLAKQLNTSQVTIRKDLDTLQSQGRLHRSHGDSGTTTTMIARALREFENLTIITNAVNIATELSGSSLEVILTGGTLRENSFSLVGPLAEETLKLLNADILFLGMDGFDVHFGLSTPNLLEAKVNRVMMDVAKLSVAVCDSSKFGRRSLCSIAPVSAIDHLITDRGVSEPELTVLKKIGMQVTLV